MSALTPLRSALRTPAAARISSPLVSSSVRRFQTHRPARMAYKDSQDRESLKPTTHEYTESGSDDQAAANTDAAFNRHKTSPEAEKDTAGQAPTEGANNPLQNSPADESFAKAGQHPGEDKTHGGKKKSSGHGSPPKGKKV
ncbi:hypothetical protein PFICI_10084 [Pestalotiopsis fici W106-1]|uniref:Uncharacterized protein n=1 Tax=Pestalotiopsis fici (strain W106-1 / CGMCC3.15140) TaxID=1229662 RepID=W3WXZ4_PESFW|nr:uncharacterized protein PFICI_10084 [Pestalotiopsis fici W106-1]ETS78022.1 hypothetical protein PFICI_10084 [Pestalotiopsis fici W106-1]